MQLGDGTLTRKQAKYSSYLAYYVFITVIEFL